MKRANIIACGALVVSAITGQVGVAQTRTVDFESATPGSVWGDRHGDSPGDPLLEENGIAVTVESFRLGGFVGFNQARIGGVYADDFPTAYLEFNNIGARFDFTSLNFDVTTVTLDYQEFGGSDNFAVNDFSIFQLAALTDLNNIRQDVAPGIGAEVFNGIITITGSEESPISSFLIGGQELGIDNIVAIPEPTTLALLGLSAAALLRRRVGKQRQR